MTQTLEQRRYTLDEYFRLSEESEEKLEYWDGIIIPLGRMLAMAGGSYEHSAITAGVVGAFISRLTESAWRVLSSDMRIKVPQSPRYVYPDATVVCGSPQFESMDRKSRTLINPRVVIEVLSPSTEAFERAGKLRQYLQIESLDEYLLVSQVEPRVEAFYRQAGGSWLFTPTAGADAVLKVRCLDIQIPLKEIYRGIEFPSPSDLALAPESLADPTT